MTDKIVSSLDEALEALDNIEEVAIIFATIDEDDITIHHLSTGRFIPKVWRLYNSDSPLRKWFDNIGIHHPDDMINIILVSFHRRLHNKPIDIEGQLRYYKNYWLMAGYNPDTLDKL